VPAGDGERGEDDGDGDGEPDTVMVRPMCRPAWPPLRDGGGGGTGPGPELGGA
jgi:hypothetical protein